MGLFGTASGSSSDEESPAVQAPTRSSRRECWEARDGYHYSCLTSKDIIIPPGTTMGDGRGPVGKLSAEEQAKEEARARKTQADLAADPCLDRRQGYEKHCARSWIDYFNKRRVLEERQRRMYAQGKAPVGSGPAPGA